MGILPISDIQVDLAWFEVSDSSFIHEKQDNFSFVSRCSFCYFILLILCVKTAIALSCTWDGNTEVIHGFGPSIFCSLTVENAPSPLSLWWHFKTDGPLFQLATGNPQCHQVHWWTMVCSVFLTMAPSYNMTRTSSTYGSTFWELHDLFNVQQSYTVNASCSHVESCPKSSKILVINHFTKHFVRIVVIWF